MENSEELKELIEHLIIIAETFVNNENEKKVILNFLQKIKL